MTRLAIFFLDAIRFQDISPGNTPFLYKMTSQGISGPLKTLLAYEGLAATLFTGIFPSEHGIWTRYYRDPAGSPFKWIGPLAPVLDKIDISSPRATKPLRYGLMRVSNRLAGISYFPGIDEVPLRQLANMNVSLKRNLFEPRCFGEIPSLFDILRSNNLSFHYFDHGLFDSDTNVMRRAVSSNPRNDVAVIRLVDLDTASHEYGLGTPSMLRSLKQTDSLVGLLVAEFRKKSPDISVLCFADHGMIPVKNIVNVEEYLRRSAFDKSKDLGMFLDSTMARFWGDSESLHELETILDRSESGRVLSEEDLTHYHIPSSSSWGDLIFLTKPGLVISPNFFDRNGTVKAMHGYAPATPGLDTIAILDSPRKNGPVHLQQIRMIDILPTALEILGLRIPSHCVGTSMLNM